MTDPAKGKMSSSESEKETKLLYEGNRKYVDH